MSPARLLLIVCGRGSSIAVLLILYANREVLGPDRTPKDRPRVHSALVPERGFSGVTWLLI